MYPPVGSNMYSFNPSILSTQGNSAFIFIVDNQVSAPLGILPMKQVMDPLIPTMHVKIINPKKKSDFIVRLCIMGMIWRMATLTAEDCQTQDGTPYEWSDYVQKVSSIIFACHSNATHFICVTPMTHIVASTRKKRHS